MTDLQTLVRQTNNPSILKMQQRLHEEVLLLGKQALEWKATCEALQSHFFGSLPTLFTWAHMLQQITSSPGNISSKNRTIPDLPLLPRFIFGTAIDDFR